MADSLTIDQKYEYCQHIVALQKQGNNFPFSVALEYCKNTFGVSPSSNTLSRVWTGREGEEEEESDALPPILLDDAREAAAKIARFMKEMTLGQMWSLCLTKRLQLSSTR
jgi:hypothetical protein